jgi:selenide,water dikinase
VKDHTAASHPDLVIGIGTGDDAGVYSLGDGRALVQTVDIVTPIVDSPSDWGRIAAANALSDIYAMGATPLTTLQYLAWPRDELPFDMASQVIEGGMDVMAEAGCTVVGGHSIDSPEPTYGFAVTGLAADDELITNSGAAPGDVLVLTKPLGIGIITTAIKRGKCPAELEALATEIMASLNSEAGAALHQHGAHAATDVTGFGLLGHLREMLDASGVGARIIYEQVPVLDGAADLVEHGIWSAGSQRNLESVGGLVRTDRTEGVIKVLADAQTSGGLLVALPPATVDGYLASVSGSVAIGSIVAEPGVEVR